MDRGISIRLLTIAAAAVFVTGCSRAPSPEISTVGSPSPTAIELRGLPSSDLAALRGKNLSADQWQEILAVRVGEGTALAIAGTYEVDGSVVRFTPMYGFDGGQTFSIAVDPRRIPNANPNEAWRQPMMQVLGVAAAAVAPSTTVRQVYPSGPELPENMLRFYIEFTGPMGRGSALEHIRLVDAEGQEVVDPFLPVEAEFWSPDRTRFTLFFDPGRVKKEIKPNRDMGRALIPARRYALVIGEEWRDGRGAPLKTSHRHEFTVVPAVERPLDPAAWTIEPPPVGTREPVTVRFPWLLDYGLLQRAITVRNGDVAVTGQVSVEQGERGWTFVPQQPWLPGTYSLDVLTALEDPAGNRIGRAFEVTQPPADERERVVVPFRPR